MRTTGLILHIPEEIFNQSPLKLLTNQIAQQTYVGSLTKSVATARDMYDFFIEIGQLDANSNTNNSEEKTSKHNIQQKLKSLFIDQSQKLTAFSKYLLSGLSVVANQNLYELFENALKAIENESWDNYVLEHHGSIAIMNQLGRLVSLAQKPDQDIEKLDVLFTAMQNRNWQDCLNGNSSFISGLCNQLEPIQIIPNFMSDALTTLTTPQLLSKVAEYEEVHVPMSIARQIGMPLDIIDSVDAYEAFAETPIVRGEIKSKSEAILASIFVRIIQVFNQLNFDLLKLKTQVEQVEQLEQLDHTSGLTVKQKANKALLETKLARQINYIATKHNILLAKYIEANDLVEWVPAQLKINFKEKPHLQHFAMQILAKKDYFDNIPQFIPKQDNPFKVNYENARLDEFKKLNKPELIEPFLKLWQANHIQEIETFLRTHIWQNQAQEMAQSELKTLQQMPSQMSVDFDEAQFLETQQHDFLEQKANMLYFSFNQKPTASNHGASVKVAVDGVQNWQSHTQQKLAQLLALAAKKPNIALLDKQLATLTEINQTKNRDLLKAFLAMYPFESLQIQSIDTDDITEIVEQIRAVLSEKLEKILDSSDLKAQKAEVDYTNAKISWPNSQIFADSICDYGMDGSKTINFTKFLTDVYQTIVQEFKSYGIELKNAKLLVLDLQQAQNASHAGSNIASTSKAQLPVHNLTTNHEALSFNQFKEFNTEQKFLAQALMGLKKVDRQFLSDALFALDGWHALENFFKNMDESGGLHNNYISVELFNEYFAKGVDIRSTEKNLYQKIVGLSIFNKDHKYRASGIDASNKAFYQGLVRVFYPHFLIKMLQTELHLSESFTIYCKNNLIKGAHKNPSSVLGKPLERMFYEVLSLFFNTVKPIYSNGVDAYNWPIIKEEKPSLEAILALLLLDKDLEKTQKSIQFIQSHVDARHQLLFFKMLAGKQGELVALRAYNLLVQKMSNPLFNGITANDINRLLTNSSHDIELQTMPSAFKRELQTVLDYVDANIPALEFEKIYNQKAKYIDPNSHHISDIFEINQRALVKKHEPTQINVDSYEQQIQIIAGMRGTPGAQILSAEAVAKLDELLKPAQQTGTQKLFRGLEAAEVLGRDGQALKKGSAYQFPNSTYASRYFKAKDPSSGKSAYGGNHLILLFAQKCAPMNKENGEEQSWRDLISPSQRFMPIFYKPASSKAQLKYLAEIFKQKAQLEKAKEIAKRHVFILEEIDENGNPLSAAQGRRGDVEALTDNYALHTPKISMATVNSWSVVSYTAAISANDMHEINQKLQNMRFINASKLTNQAQMPPKTKSKEI